MKKSILTLFACLIAVIVIAQDKPKEAPVKQDTIVAVQMNINQFRAVISAIDQNIDSKRISKELIEFLSKSAKIVEQKPQPVIKPAAP